MNKPAHVTYILLLSLIIMAGGCATASKNGGDLEAQGLRNQISLLKSEVRLKTEEISGLKNEIWELNQLLGEKKNLQKKDSEPSIKQVQSALRNAGFDPGAIDGQMGKKTKKAIKAFQTANALKVDGKADKETWNLLKKYLDKKTK